MSGRKQGSLFYDTSTQTLHSKEKTKQCSAECKVCVFTNKQVPYNDDGSQPLGHFSVSVTLLTVKLTLLRVLLYSV